MKARKILSFAYFFICLSAMMTVGVNAYLDPSVMTYTIQVIAGIAIAVGATVGLYFRKAKKKVQDKLGIDEDAKKEKEEDIVFDEGISVDEIISDEEAK